MSSDVFKTVAFHSVRGGTGKSVLSLNIAYLLGNAGHNVALLDYDLRAPSLYFMLRKPSVSKFLNDYLEGEAKYSDILVDVSRRLGVRGKVVVAFSDPSLEAVKEMMTKTRKWEMGALRRLIALIRKLRGNGFNWVLIDSPPGPQYSSINAIVASDIVVLVVTPDKVEMESCRPYISEVYRDVVDKVYLIVNKVPASSIDEAVGIAKSLARSLGVSKLLGTVPYYPEVLLYNGDKIMAKDFPNHPYSRLLNEIVRELTSLPQSPRPS